jgi:hypothetical protein
VAVAPDASGHGYWLLTSTGNIYAFGDAPYLGAPGAQSSPLTSMVATPDGGGYWTLSANGGVFASGDATGLGSVAPGGAGVVDPATSIFSSSDGAGYWIANAAGHVFAFGDAPNEGDISSVAIRRSIIAGAGF